MKSINAPSDINVSRILRLVWQKRGISRIEIASQLGIDKSTVTKIVASLIDMGLISELSEGNTGPQGGRKPIFLEISPSFACVGGVEINSGRYVCCLLDMYGKVLFQYAEAIEPGSYEIDRYQGIFLKAFETLSSEAEKKGLPLVGIGLGFPGIVNSEEGIITQSVPLMIDEPYAFVEEVSKEVAIPLFIENDARCCCYGEMLLAKTHDVKNMLYVLAEYRILQPTKSSQKNLSVGLGIVFDGLILKGADFSAGEFRSLLWDEGNKGQFYSGEKKLEQLDEGAVQPVFFELAQHIAFLVNTLNINQVYIGGIDKKYAEQLIDSINTRIRFQWPYKAKQNYKVSLASLEMFAVSYGAAAMFLEQIFALPNLSLKSGMGESVLKTFESLKKN